MEIAIDFILLIKLVNNFKSKLINSDLRFNYRIIDAMNFNKTSYSSVIPFDFCKKKHKLIEMVKEDGEQISF